MARQIVPMTTREMLKYASAALASPPKPEWVERVTPEGRLVATFVLPLQLCKPFNQLGRAGTAASSKMLGRLKSTAYATMRMQNQGRNFKSPLGGRPDVLVTRFSSTPVDRENGGSKNIVDRLRVGHNGIGLIKDDSVRCINLQCWWEYAPPARGFVLCRVFEGAI